VGFEKMMPGASSFNTPTATLFSPLDQAIASKCFYTLKNV
jgi:hypothetical protein